MTDVHVSLPPALRRALELLADPPANPDVSKGYLDLLGENTADAVPQNTGPGQAAWASPIGSLLYDNAQALSRRVLTAFQHPARVAEHPGRAGSRWMSARGRATSPRHWHDGLRGACLLRLPGGRDRPERDHRPADLGSVDTVDAWWQREDPSRMPRFDMYAAPVRQSGRSPGDAARERECRDDRCARRFRPGVVAAADAARRGLDEVPRLHRPGRYRRHLWRRWSGGQRYARLARDGRCDGSPELVQRRRPRLGRRARAVARRLAGGRFRRRAAHVPGRPLPRVRLERRRPVPVRRGWSADHRAPARRRSRRLLGGHGAGESPGAAVVHPHAGSGAARVDAHRPGHGDQRRPGPRLHGDVRHELGSR